MIRKKQKIDFKYNLREYWNLLKKHKKIFFSLLVIVLLLEALYTVDKFLFKRIIDDGSRFISGNLSQETFILTLVFIALVFIVVSILKASFKWLSIHFLSLLDSTLVFDLKRKYFNHLLGLSYKFHTTHKTGKLISRIIRGSGAVEGFNDNLIFNFVPLLFQLVLVGGSIAYFNWQSSLILIITSVLFIGYSLFIQTKQQSHRIRFNRIEDSEKGLISDVFTNIDSIKYFGKESTIKRIYLKAAEKTKKASLRYWGYFRWFDSGQILILSFGLFFLIYFPMKSFLDGSLSIGTLVFIYSIYENVAGPLFGFVWGIRGFYRSMADFQGLFEYSKVKNEIKDKPNARELKIRKGEIEFKNITFGYTKKKKIFENFNLKIKSGQKVALVGHSGCGKTTLIKLLYRLYDVENGQILIDGKDIRDFKQESLRSEMAIVPQECILFDDTIYNNVKFANPKATREEVMEAIRMAQLDKIVERLPRKERTIVGERGVKLSGGEKQRVSIARALLANKKIIVLDEATSALDSETEHEIQESLKTLLQGRTAIIIAHRLSTIMNADKIVVMKDGNIVQQGTHNKLIKEPGEYRKLWNLQRGGYLK